ncbi:hypothetical protein METP3_03737 [Methanosarcinales archaeon]|nr:hypothetical protein METP3_03737 [Methanosarcinales archaeon]
MNNKKDEFTEFWGEPISIYNYKMADEDGILVPTGHPLFAIDGTWEQFASSKEKYERKLLSKLIQSVIIEIQKQYIKDHKKADTFYAVEARGWKFFVAQNESGFTLMFPGDY